jgi:hypothetical protein
VVNNVKERILGITKGALGPQEIERSLIYWNARTLKKGEEVVPGSGALAMPFEGIVVFADLAPRFNWTHPCLYVFIGKEPLQTKVVHSSFPPAMDRPGDRWTVLLRFGKNPEDEHDFDVFR